MGNKNKRVNSLAIKFAAYLITVVITIGLMVTVLYQIQTRGQEEYQKRMSFMPLLDEVTKELDQKTENIATLTDRFHSANQTTIRLVGLFMESGAFVELQSANSAISGAESLRGLSENTGLYSTLIIDTAGNLILMDNVDVYKRNGEDFQFNVIKTETNPQGVFTPEQFRQITASDNGWEGTYRVNPDGTSEYAAVHAIFVASDGQQYNGYYYSAPLLSTTGDFTGYYLVAMADSDQMDKDIENLKNIRTVLGSIGVGKTGIVFSLDPETGDFLFFEDHDGNVYTGESYKSIGITDEVLTDGYSGMQEIDGKQYYCVAKNYSSEVFGDCVVIVASLPESEMYSSRLTNVFWSVLAFVLVGNMILTYAIILQVDQVRKGTVFEARRILFTTKSGIQVYYNKTLGLRIFPLLVVGLVIILGISFYTQTLTQLTSAVNVSESRIKAIGTSVDNNHSTSETIMDFFDKQNLYKSRLLADILRRTPKLAFEYDLTDIQHYEYARDDNNSIVLDDYGNPVLTGRFVPNLQALCDSYGLSSIYIFNDRGRVIATNKQWWNFVLSEDPNSQSYPFHDLLMNTDSYIQGLQVNDVGEVEQYIGHAFFYYTYNDKGTTRFVSEYEFKNGITDDNGKVIVAPSKITRHRGFVQIGISYKILEEVLNMATLQYTLNGMNMFYDGYFIGFEGDENHTLLFSPFENEDAVQVKDSMFSGAFNGYLTVNGEKCFSSIRKEGNIFIGTAIPSRTLFSLRNNIALATVLFSFAAFVILLGFMLYSDSREDDQLKERLIKQQEEEEEENPEGSANFDVQMPDGKKIRVKSVTSRWSKRFTEWQKKSVEQKFSFILNICIYPFFTFILASVLFSRFIYAEDSIMHYIINGNLERSPNLFVFTRCAIYFVLVFVGAWITEWFINTMTVNLGARAETVGHLFQSFIKYGGVIGVLFHSLYLMGMNTASLLTSAGILSIVIGLGAQSLISDILAGIFIVFEGEFRAGDIVTVGDFRGTVLEIGIRTTKIEDFVGNIKIYNNSSISGVLNMTKEFSTVSIELAIEYGESLERVETVLKNEFPAIKKKLKTIVSGPFYKGVQTLGESSVNLLVLAQCLEGDRIQLMRDLNRELYLVFNKHNINIPFPQVTISHLKEDSSDASKEAKTLSREAQEFIKEQKEASAGVDAR